MKWKPKFNHISHHVYCEEMKYQNQKSYFMKRARRGVSFIALLQVHRSRL